MKNLKRNILKIIAVTLILGLLAGCSSGSNSASNQSQPANQAQSSNASDEVVVLKFGMVDNERSNYYRGAKKIAEEVEKATNGRVKIEIYPSSQLGNERDMWEGASMGTIDIATAANAVISGFIPDVKVLDQPYLFDTAEQAHKVIDGKLGEEIAKKALEQGIHIVGWMESGFRDVFSSRPVKTLEDFKGLKIRTMENDMHIAAFNALGAIATPMAAGEQFTALQQKTIDAGENAIANVLANNFYSLTPHITRTHHLFVFIGVGVSDKAWNKIPEDLRDDFAAAVRRGCEAQRQYLVEANEEAEKELVKLGVTFYDIDREAVKKAMEPAMEKFKSQLNQEWLQIIESEKN